MPRGRKNKVVLLTMMLKGAAKTLTEKVMLNQPTTFTRSAPWKKMRLTPRIIENKITFNSTIHLIV